MFSSVFYMKSGMGQGKINSSRFYNVYINDLIVKLRNSGYGCYIGFIFACCFLQIIFCFYLLIFYIYNACLSYVVIMVNGILFNQKKVVFAAS